MAHEQLTPFQKGVSGNPNGRPKKKKERGTIIKHWLGAKSEGINPVTKLDESLTQEDWIVIAMIGQARKGNVRAAEFLFDAKYGALLKTALPNPDDTGNKPEDFAPFTIVDPVENQVVEIEIGAAS